MVQAATVGSLGGSTIGQIITKRLLPKAVLLRGAKELEMLIIKKLLISSCVALLLGSSTYYLFVYHNNSSDSLNRSVIEIVQSNTDISPAERANKLKQIAAQHGITIESLEAIIAKEILDQREQVKYSSGGYNFGIHIIHGKDADRIDPNTVRKVDGIMSFDGFDKKEGFRYPKDFYSDKSMYIDAANTKSTILEKSKFLGYFRSGSYLQGDSYAKTSQLKEAEKTPTGNRGWTGVTRIYSDPNGLGIIIFEESDFLASKGVVLVPDNALNTKVGKYSATLSKIEDPTGLKMTHLDWTNENQHNYSLNIQKTDESSVLLLKELAESIANTNR